MNKEIQYVIDTSYGDKKVDMIDQYGDSVGDFMKPIQQELNLNSICSVIFWPTGNSLFEIAGINDEEAISNAKLQVSLLLNDWDGLGESVQQQSSSYMRELICMLRRDNAIKYKIK